MLAFAGWRNGSWEVEVCAKGVGIHEEQIGLEQFAIFARSHLLACVRVGFEIRVCLRKGQEHENLAGIISG